jgi:hypothetical protein
VDGLFGYCRLTLRVDNSKIPRRLVDRCRTSPTPIELASTS